MTLLITGGASGIGAETARRAAARGYKVAINYRSRDAQAKKVVADIDRQGRPGGRPAGRHGSREADIVRLFEDDREGARPDHPSGEQRRHRPQRTRVDEYDAARAGEISSPSTRSA